MTARQHLQVKLRVELGPADVQQGTCVLATAAATPGELAVKAKHKVSRGRPCVQHFCVHLVRVQQPGVLILGMICAWDLSMTCSLLESLWQAEDAGHSARCHVVGPFSACMAGAGPACNMPNQPNCRHACRVRCADHT